MKNFFLILCCCLLLTGCASKEEMSKIPMPNEESWSNGMRITTIDDTDERITKAINEYRFGDTSNNEIALTYTRVTAETHGGSIPEKGSYYKLKATGLSVGDQYILYTKNLAGKHISGGEYFVAEDLKPVIKNRQQPDCFDQYIGLDKILKGEPIAVILLCKNKDLIAVTEISANPIEAAWSDGATVAVTSISENMDVFLMQIHGLKPNEEISSVSESWDETLTTTDRADENGCLRKILSPMVIGHDGGDNKVTITRSETGEKVYLEIPFGTFSKDANSFEVKLQRNSNKST